MTAPEINLPHVAARLFGSPLLIEPRKLEEIVTALYPRLLGGELAAGRPSPAVREGLEVRDGVAVIPIMGTLVNRGDWLSSMSGMTSYARIHAQLDAALADTSVQGILLDIDSPGGEAAGNFDLADAIYAARSEKPVWAIANDVAASGGYSIASAAERVFVTQTALVGSIGVIMAHRDVSARNEREGVRYTSIYAGARKNDLNPNAPLTEEALSAAQERVNDLYGLFVATVARNRGLSEKAVRGTEAGVFTGKKAVSLGLADDISTFADAFSALREHAAKPTTTPTKEKTTMTEPTPPETPAPAAHTGPSQADLEAAVAAERERGEKIIACAAKLGVSADEAQRLIKAGVTLEQAQSQLIDKAAAQSPTGGIRNESPDELPAADSELPEEQAAADWAKDSRLRAEFESKEDYVAFRKADAKGLVRVMKK